PGCGAKENAPCLRLPHSHLYPWLRRLLPMTKPITDQTLQSSILQSPGLQALDMRSRDIFRRIVDSYLRDGEPVGSRSLSRLLPSSLSPATIRNVMSDLEH